MRPTRLLVATLLLLSSFALAASQTFTGKVTDDMCGKKHMSPGKSDAACTRECVKMGSGYALVVGDKVYKLKGASDQLDKYAGARAAVTGTVSGDTIQVSSVSVAR